VPTTDERTTLHVLMMTNHMLVDEKKIINELQVICDEHELRRQFAEEQGYLFDEDLPTILGEYVESLPEHERKFARSIEVEEGV
jgi:hypothetical protein